VDAFSCAMGKEHAIIVRYRETWFFEYDLVILWKMTFNVLLRSLMECRVEVGRSIPHSPPGHVGRGAITVLGLVCGAYLAPPRRCISAFSRVVVQPKQELHTVCTHVHPTLISNTLITQKPRNIGSLRMKILLCRVSRSANSDQKSTARRIMIGVCATSRMTV